MSAKPNIEIPLMPEVLHHDHSACMQARRAVQDTLEVLSGKWKLPIIISLSFKNYRFKELVREIGISPRMLSKELQDLEMNQLINRRVFDTKPITVEYSITPYADSLKKVIAEMGAWGMEHRKTIMHPGKAE